MSGKVIALLLAAMGVVAGAAIYYLQVFYFYERVEPAGFVLQTQGGERSAEATDIRAIDAISSPIRFRACFDTDLTPDVEALSYLDAVPLNAPFWFGCFDAGEIAEKLADGSARAFVGQKNVDYGTDRIVAITDDGRGFVWHQLNHCGDIAYDGTRVGEACPPREDFE